MTEKQTEPTTLKEKLDRKTKEFSKAVQKETMKASKSSSSNGKRKRKLLFTPGTQSSPFNERGPFINLMGKLDIANMTSADYSKHIKELNATVIFYSKKNKTLQCPECMFSTTKKEEFIDHKNFHIVNETTEKKGRKDCSIKKV